MWCKHVHAAVCHVAAPFKAELDKLGEEFGAEKPRHDVIHTRETRQLQADERVERRDGRSNVVCELWTVL